MLVYFAILFAICCYILLYCLLYFAQARPNLLRDSYMLKILTTKGLAVSSIEVAGHADKHVEGGIYFLYLY